MPILVAYNIRIGELYRGGVKIDACVSTFMIKIGFGGSAGIASNCRGYLSCGKNAGILFKGRAYLAEGASLRVDSGKLTFGNNFSANKNCFIACNDEIKIGDDVLLGWDVNIRDSDGHRMYVNGAMKTPLKSIVIGAHTWICSCVDILKGAIICAHSVVAYRSCVVGVFSDEHVLIGGYPAKILQRDIDWEE